MNGVEVTIGMERLKQIIFLLDTFVDAWNIFHTFSVWGLLPHPVVSSTCGDLSGTVGTTGFWDGRNPRAT